MNPLQFIVLAEKVLKPFELFSSGFFLALDSYAIAKAKSRSTTTTKRKKQTK
ncbi:MAG: hypothetical protein JXR88_14565 [Clostridia bacterium]|nr:hypothetical protein [Clostridia bacterium]